MTANEGLERPHVLDFEQLRAALNGAIDLTIDRFGPKVDVAAVPEYNDYYWHLPTDTAHAMDDDPGLYVNAGQSSDDLEELAEMLSQPQDQVLWHSVEHLVGLLNLVSFLADPRRKRSRPLGASAPSSAPLHRANETDS
ncbi:hypothetical protein [Kineococcus sp. R86509]|uniref:hypothetical protein n=1 Tax=Kineococcus sp. R86509 TaxID=3093851 RepID=UPI0036D31A91